MTTRAAILTAVFCPLTSVLAATLFGPLKIMDDVTLGTWSAPSTCTATAVAGGAWTNGVCTNWYRVVVTNAKGRTAPSPSTVAVIGTATNGTNAISLTWSRYDGAQGYAIERSRDGATWTNWIGATAAQTNLVDWGTNAWAAGSVTSLLSVIPAPRHPFMMSNMVDGVTIVYSNGALTVIGEQAAIEVDTLATVLARGNDAEGYAITNVGATSSFWDMTARDITAQHLFGNGAGLTSVPEPIATNHAAAPLSGGAHGGEADTLASVLGRGNNANAIAITNVSSIVGPADEYGLYVTGSSVQIKNGPASGTFTVDDADRFTFEGAGRSARVLFGANATDQAGVLSNVYRIAVGPGGIVSEDGGGKTNAVTSAGFVDIGPLLSSGSGISSIGLYSNTTHVGSITGLSVVGASAVTVAGGVGTVTIPPDVDAAGGHSGTTNRGWAMAFAYTQSVAATTWTPVMYDVTNKNENACLLPGGTNVQFTGTGRCRINHMTGITVGSAKAVYTFLEKNGQQYQRGQGQTVTGTAFIQSVYEFDNDATTNRYAVTVYQGDTGAKTLAPGAGQQVWMTWEREL